MSQPTMQKSFNSGEWAPQLYSRVDMEKYHSGAALLGNFFVDYRGGASSRTGTKYILQAFNSAYPVRLIPFQASFAVSYILEFGNGYIRFYNNAAPVLEASDTITGVSNANPCVVSVANSYSVGDWVYITGVGGTTQLNGNYYIIAARSGGSITLSDLNGVPINSAGYPVYTGAGTTSRVYTITSPYAAADLALIKFAQNVNSLILCHPNYPTQILTLVTANNWTLLPVTYGTVIGSPLGLTVTTTLSPGSVNYAYEVTSVAADGEESGASPPVLLSGYQDLRTVAGSISVSWSPVANAVSYNIYKSTVSYFGAIPVGIPYGFVGNVTGSQLVDSNIAANYSVSPPIPQNPFTGGQVSSIVITAQGTYTSVPSVTLTGASTVPATASVSLTATAISLTNGGGSYAVGDSISFGNGVQVKVLTTATGGIITSIYNSSTGAITSGSTPTNPLHQTGTSGAGTGAQASATWGLGIISVNNPGSGYASAPTVSLSGSGGGSAVANTTPNTTFPAAVPGFFQQRLILADQGNNPGGMNFSQPDAYFNFNISNPIQADDAISVTLASGQLETIKSLVPTAPGLVVFTDKASWLVNGGSLGSAITPSSIVANRQSFNGANDMPPILNNYDILYVESKGSVVRDATYNYYAQVFTGSDISLIASHLFYGYQLTEWAFAQEPFKLVWCVRSDGVMLTLTFAKEQEFIAWSHHNTAGLFKSVATVVETTSFGPQDAIYTVVQRTINGNTVKYIERFAERYFPTGATDAWCVDAAIQYNGSPTLAFTGAVQLNGATVTGLATDNLGNVTVITPFAMPLGGAFTLPAPAGATGYTRVTIGLAFTPQLQTLPIDQGEPTIQGKQKKINAVTVRCTETLGLQIGSAFNKLVNMKDLIVGNVGSLTNTTVTDLVTGNARTFVDPKWAEQGQFCIQQSLPYPATITGVIPQLTVGDT